MLILCHAQANFTNCLVLLIVIGMGCIKVSRCNAWNRSCAYSVYSIPTSLVKRRVVVYVANNNHKRWHTYYLNAQSPLSCVHATRYPLVWNSCVFSCYNWQQRRCLLLRQIYLKCWNRGAKQVDAAPKLDWFISPGTKLHLHLSLWLLMVRFKGARARGWGSH